MPDNSEKRARRLQIGKIIKPILGFGISLAGIHALFEIVRKLEIACSGQLCPNVQGETLVVGFCCILAGVGAATTFKALFEQS